MASIWTSSAGKVNSSSAISFQVSRERQHNLRNAGFSTAYERALGPGCYQADFAGEEVLHHTLLKLASFRQLGFEGGDFGVAVGEDCGDGGLFAYDAEGHAIAR